MYEIPNGADVIVFHHAERSEHAFKRSTIVAAILFHPDERISNTGPTLALSLCSKGYTVFQRGEYLTAAKTWQVNKL